VNGAARMPPGAPVHVRVEPHDVVLHPVAKKVASKSGEDAA
jgi:hypothetical protein